MIPDIGAPGMNTYVEIIAPFDAINTFGSNGPSLNKGDGTDNVSVTPANLSDTNRIVVGPLVVSWDARLIATQIFVKPGATVGIVPLRITVGGLSTVINEFEIVTPQILGTGGTVTGGGIIGQGGFGVRSKRGAMIVDRLVLDGGEYRISTQDPDLSTPGNQGYLPFILISKGLLAITPGTTLRADGSTLDAGPGGGGGGGFFCDKPFVGTGNPGSNGGAGYTGGGSGGRNNNNGTGSYNAVGNGSGQDGKSLNGIDPGGYNACSSWEGAGGGTGHPFGSSAPAACLPASGTFGGGTTAGNTGGGGGAGYGSNGQPGSGLNASNNYGRQHGNRQGVPVAGGSGGGSGNPQSAGILEACAGAGGGGGGAIALFSMETLNNNLVSAKGGDGGSRSGATSGAGGGAGSGGYITLGAKVGFSGGGSGDVTGGAGGNSNGGNGAPGRARFDGFTLGVQPTFDGQSDPYIGPTIDTLTYWQSPTIPLHGTFNGNDAIRVYMKKDGGGSWRQVVPDPTYVGREWNQPVTVTEGEGLYYFVAVQVVPTPSTDPNQSEPSWVFSQAAANMIYVDLIPKIEVDRTSLSFPDVACEHEMFDTVKIWNSGDDTLIVTNPTVTGDFSILPPYGTTFRIAPTLAPPYDTVRMVIRFAPTTPGAKTGTLTLPNNDPRTGKNPVLVQLTGTKLNIQSDLSPRIIDFGEICQDAITTASARFSVTGDLNGAIKSITRLGSGPTPFALIAPLPASLPLAVASGSTSDITVEFRPTATGTFIDSFQVVVDPCDSSYVVVVTGRAIETAVRVMPNPLPFGSVLIGDPSPSIAVTIENTGSDPAVITDMFIRPAGAPYTAPTGLIGTSVAPGATNAVSGAVTFTPTTPGLANAELVVILGTLCPDTAIVTIVGNGIRCAQPIPAPLSLDFEQVLLGTSRLDTVTLTNNSADPMEITEISVPAPWSIVEPTPPLTLLPSGSVQVVVRFTPADTQTVSDKITIRQATPCPDSLFVLVTGNGRCATVQSDSLQIDFGSVIVGASDERLFTLTNPSAGPMDITEITATAPWTILQPTPPLSLAPGGTVQVRVRFQPTDTVLATGSLVIKQNTPCLDSITVPLRGTGRIIVGGRALIVIPQTVQGSPGDRIAIPIVLQEAQLLRESEATTIRATMRFNGTLLYPVGIRSKGEPFQKTSADAATTVGSIISRHLVNGEQVLTFELQNNPVPLAPDTLGYIDVVVALGNALTTPISFDTLFWTDGEVEQELRDGLFSLSGYCDEGGTRLFLQNGTFGIKQATPNPFNPSTEISFESIGSDKTSLVIYDLYGRPVETLVNEEPLPAGVYTRPWNALNFPSGIYHAVLTSSNLRSSHRIVLLK